MDLDVWKVRPDRIKLAKIYVEVDKRRDRNGAAKLGEKKQSAIYLTVLNRYDFCI